MKNLIFRSFCFFALTLVACSDGIDPITLVNPGPDQGAPVVVITSPSEGAVIQELELISSINIDFEVSDDIEIESVSVLIDGAQIATFTEFLDYRRFVMEDLKYDNIDSGDHTITVTATDMAGNETSASSNFSKAPPYTPVFAGELIYMPFDGTFVDLIAIEEATEVGTPGFAGQGFVGSNSYKASADSYLTYPVDGLFGDSFSAAFWYKVDASPDRAGLLVVGDDADDRQQGFRLFREGNASEQTIKLNVGTGGGESWNDGGVLDATSGEWVHIAFTVSPTESVIYFNGEAVNTGTLSSPIDWTGANTLTIGAGGETFSYWNHNSDNSFMDELRMFNTTLSQSDIQSMMNMFSPYEPVIEGETFYMPFNGNYTERITSSDATVIGSPGFMDGVDGEAYDGAPESYLTFPTDNLLSTEFSATMWYNLDADPDRAGILIIGPEDSDNANFPDVQNKRSSGFRFFREGGATNQVFKLNVGNGDGDNWFDGGAVATIDPTVTMGWVHLAFTISDSEVAVYINGEIVSQGSFTGIDWEGCDLLSIMSGGPRFSEWGHASDSSGLDELKLYNIALTQEQIQSLL